MITRDITLKDIGKINHYQTTTYKEWIVWAIYVIYAMSLNMNKLSKKPFVYPTFFSCDQAALGMAQSVRPSVCLWHLFHYVPIIVSSWNFL